MKKNIIGMAVAATLGMAAFSASAEDMYRGAWYAVPGVSYMAADKDLETNNSGGGGFLSIGKELSEKFDVQGRLGYNSASNDLNDPAFPTVGGRYKQTTVGLDALYMFSRDKLRPFLLAGGGYAYNDIDYSMSGVKSDGTKDSWMANVGAGAQYLINDKFGLQADLRYVWSEAELKLTNNATGATYKESDTIGNTIFSIGGIYRFGEPAPVVPVVAAAPVVAAVVAPEPTPEPAPAPAPAPAPVCEPKVDTLTISGEELFGFDKSKLSDGGNLNWITLLLY